MNINKFLSKNLWNIIVLSGALLGAFVMIRAQIQVNAQAIEMVQARLDKIENLVERVIVLEEHDKGTAEDLSEIKGDLKDIKRHFEIQP